MRPKLSKIDQTWEIVVWSKVADPDFFRWLPKLAVIICVGFSRHIGVSHVSGQLSQERCFSNFKIPQIMQFRLDLWSISKPSSWETVTSNGCIHRRGPCSFAAFKTCAKELFSDLFHFQIFRNFLGMSKFVELPWNSAFLIALSQFHVSSSWCTVRQCPQVFQIFSGQETRFCTPVAGCTNNFVESA